jgi:hypothetical protein
MVTKNSRNSINLRKKREIAKDAVIHNRSAKELKILHDVSNKIIRTSIAQANELLNLDSDDPILENFRIIATNETTMSLDRYILQGIIKLREQGCSINLNTIKFLGEKYKSINNDCNTKISPHFLRMFKKRNTVIYKRIYGESKSADMSKIKEFFVEYNILKDKYNPEDIFNVDETSLYIKNYGRASYILKDNDDLKGTKVDKTRITLVLGFNRFGKSLKEPLLIGRSKNPRIFKTMPPTTFNLRYTANKTSWLTKEIFIEYLSDINQQLQEKNKKILLILDNFSGHNVTDLSNIKILKLPANTTSVLQPLDLGVINAIKQRYKSYVSTYISTRVFEKEDSFKISIGGINLADVCFWIRESIDAVNIEVYGNCWDKFLNMDEYNREDFYNGEDLLEREINECECDDKELDIEDIIEINPIYDNFNNTVLYLNKIEETLHNYSEDVLFNFMKFKHSLFYEKLKKKKLIE